MANVEHACNCQAGSLMMKRVTGGDLEASLGYSLKNLFGTPGPSRDNLADVVIDRVK